MRLLNCIMSSSSGTALIAVLIIAAIINIVFAGIFMCLGSTIKKSGWKRVSTGVLNIAEAGKEDFYAQIRTKSYKPTANNVKTVISSRALGNGSYSVRCSTGINADTVWVRSKGESGSIQRTVEVIASIGPSVPFSLPPILAAITAVLNTSGNGNINVDGRDHDSLSMVIGNGVFGIATFGTSVNWGSATIGGNGISPKDKKTIGPYRTQLIRENMTYDTRYDSPESYLGLGANDLDTYKSASIPAPFNALIYDTVSTGPIHFGTISRGILIVHNSTKTAEFDANTGEFHGLIICDKLSKINGNVKIVGAIVVLDQANGNGGADVLYSSQVLGALSTMCTNIPLKLKEIAWREL